MIFKFVQILIIILLIGSGEILSMSKRKCVLFDEITPRGKKHMITTFSPSDFEVIEFGEMKHERIRVRPMYHELGFSDRSKIYGRRIIFDRLVIALEHLPKEYGLQIWDVYRPREVQGELFEWMKGQIRKTQPDITADKVYDEARKYMSPPSKVGEKYCAPHLSGGAIDLTLFDVKSGKELNMGTVFDDCTECAHRNYFEDKKELTSEEISIRDRRRLFTKAMETTGFASYQYEWWHFDIGNIFWSRQTEKPEVFGPLFGDREWPE